LWPHASPPGAPVVQMSLMHSTCTPLQGPCMCRAACACAAAQRCCRIDTIIHFAVVAYCAVLVALPRTAAVDWRWGLVRAAGITPHLQRGAGFLDQP
jgi:hypothetical protein